MSAKLKPYPEYRDSGVDWLGKLPAHWIVDRAKAQLREVDERSLTGDEELLSVSHKTGVTPRRLKNITMFKAESYAGYKLARSGDLVVNTMWAWMAALGVSQHDGIVSNAYGVYRPREGIEMDGRYYDRLLRTETYRAEYIRRSTGITTSRLRLYPPKLLAMPLIQPPPEEQRRIADFLDAYNAQVHRLIAAKRRTIAALIERKRSIITNRLYTIGDAGSPPTPSNPDWPFRAIKRIANVSFSSVDKHIYEHERQVRVCNYVDVYKNDRVGLVTPFREGSVTEAEYGNYALKAGDVIVTKDSEDWKDICVPCLVTDDIPDTVCGYHLAILRPNTEQISGEYLYFALLAAPTTWQFHKAATGITRYGIGKNEIGVAVIPLPPRTEQDEICHALARELESVDAAKDKVSREIDLILEYRDSLIAAVVTGQLDVREAAVRIVEGDELADDTAIEEEDMEDALDAVD
jgi:type I restriction enzyme, S subunit